VETVACCSIAQVIPTLDRIEREGGNMIAPLLLAADFMNFTYAANPCYKNVPVPAVMVNGSFSYFDQSMGAGFDLRVDSVTRGSLAPGTQQAVVVLVCDFPVGGTAEAYIFTDRGSSATMLGDVATANWGPDWGAGPNSIHVNFKNGYLYVDACNDNDCTMNIATTYALKHGRLVKAYEKTRKNSS
jgi:hypothetical protein